MILALYAIAVLTGLGFTHAHLGALSAFAVGVVAMLPVLTIRERKGRDATKEDQS